MGVQINGSEGNVVATKGTYSGNVTIGGTLTYEDVTNIDSVGLVTARTGIEIGARPGVAASISVDGNMIVSGISTFGGDVQVPDKIIHSGDTNTAIRFPAADTVSVETAGSERLRIASDGKVGINQSSPTISQFEVKSAQLGGTAGNTQEVVRLYSPDVTNTTSYRFTNYRVSNGTSHSSSELRFRRHVDVTDMGYFGLGDSYVSIGYGTAEKLRITSAGRVGIGENSPDALLHLATGASTTCEIRLTSNNTGSGSGDRGRLNVYSAKDDGTAWQAGYIDIDRSSGTETTAQMTFNVNNGSGVTEWVRIEPKGRILAARNTSGSQGLINPGVILDRQTARVGTNSNTFNGVGIIKDSNGWGTALYIKRTSDGAGEGFFCEFAYASLATSGTTIGSITNNGASNVSYVTSSDYRLKQDISSITDAISSLKKLTPRKFRWKTDLDLGYQDGFIAHEVQETGIFSHLVHGEKDGTKQAENEPDKIIPAYQQMDYSKLTPTLVAAVQELSAEIESLKSEIAALKSN